MSTIRPGEGKVEVTFGGVDISDYVVQRHLGGTESEWAQALALRPAGFAPDKWAELLETLVTAWSCSVLDAADTLLRAASGGQINDYYRTIDGELA